MGRVQHAARWSFAFAVAALLAVAPVDAKSVDAKSVNDKSGKAKIPDAPAKLPQLNAARLKNLDFLFDALKAAPDEISAKAVEARIWAIWLKTPSDTAALLMTRARAAMEAKDMDVAQKLLDAVIKLRPDYVEAWNKRATLFYMQNDYTRAINDIQEVLRREPRHFGAWAGLGIILEETGDDKHALEALRHALALNPYLEKVPDMVKSLSEKVEGRDI